MASKMSFKGKPSRGLKQFQQEQKVNGVVNGATLSPNGLEFANMAASNGQIPVNPNDPAAIRSKVRK
jgi:hypothetical protein